MTLTRHQRLIIDDVKQREFIENMCENTGFTKDEVTRLVHAAVRGKEDLQEERRFLVPIQGETFKLINVFAPTKLKLAINTVLNLPVSDLLLVYKGGKSGYIHRETMSV